MIRTEPVYGNFVAGDFTEPGATFDDIDPANPGDVVGCFPVSSGAEVDAAVSAAERALPDWRKVPAVVRGRSLLAMARWLRENEEEIVSAITREQGKPLAESRGELGKTLEYFEYYAGLAYEFGGRILASGRPGVDVQIRREPVGVCALITPWNVPIAIPARKIAPAFVCGNTVVLKPSEETPLSAHFLARAAQAASVPAGVFNVVHGRGAEAGDALARDARVRAISFTGSTEVGRRLAVIAAERLIRVQLELGGKNASIVLEDADLDLAADQIAAAAFTTTGQQCTATSRVLVRREVVGEFVEKLVGRAGALKVGAGTEPDVKVGPLVSERQLETSLKYVRLGKDEGAQLVLGGERESRDGWFLGPTIFVDVRPEMQIARDEIFGPVLAVVPVEDDDEAIRVANDSTYGLSAAVYTNSLSRAYRLMSDIDVGAFAVNLPSAGWEVQTAFGGVKESGGSGWKEQGVEALDFFSELKAVQILPGS